MFSYTQNDIDESVNRFVNGISGPLRDMMSQGNNVENLKAIFRDTNASSEAVINGSALEKVDDTADNASVLVSVRVTVTNLDGVNAPSKPYRLRVIVHEDDNGRMTGYDLKYPDGETDGSLEFPADGARRHLVRGRLRRVGRFRGTLYWNRVERVGEQEARAELPQLAAQQIPIILGFDYQTIERSRTDAYRLLTSDFRREYEDDTTKNVIPAARERQLISQVNVVGVGMLDAHRDSGSVMVYMNRVLTDKTKQPLYDGSRLKVDYQKVGQDWRIRNIT